MSNGKIKCLKFTGLTEKQHTWFDEPMFHENGDPVKDEHGNHYHARRHAHKDDVVPISRVKNAQHYVNMQMAEVIEVDDASDTTPPEDSKPTGPQEETAPRLM